MTEETLENLRKDVFMDDLFSWHIWNFFQTKLFSNVIWSEEIDSATGIWFCKMKSFFQSTWEQFIPCWRWNTDFW